MTFFPFLFYSHSKSNHHGTKTTQGLPAIHAEHPRARHGAQPPRLHRERLRGHPRLPPAAARPANRPRRPPAATPRARQGAPRPPPLRPPATAGLETPLPLRRGRTTLPARHRRRGEGEKRRRSTPRPSAGRSPPSSPPNGNHSPSSSPYSGGTTPATPSLSATPVRTPSCSSSSTPSSSAAKSSQRPRTPTPTTATATSSPSSTSPFPTTSPTHSPRPSPASTPPAPSSPSSPNTAASAPAPSANPCSTSVPANPYKVRKAFQTRTTASPVTPQLKKPCEPPPSFSTPFSVKNTFAASISSPPANRQKLKSKSPSSEYPGIKDFPYLPSAESAPLNYSPSALIATATACPQNNPPPAVPQSPQCRYRCIPADFPCCKNHTDITPSAACSSPPTPYTPAQFL